MRNTLNRSSETTQDELRHSDLLVKRSQDIFASDRGNIRENYVRGYTQIYLLVEAFTVGEQKHRFPFLITQDEVTICWTHGASPTHGKTCRRSDAENNALVEMGVSFDNSGAMLNGVCDFIDPPEQIIPSRVWSLGFDEIPLVGREFLFYSTFPSHPPIWESIRLPSISVYAPKWKADAGCTAPVRFDNFENSSIECGPQALDNAHGTPSQILWEVYSELRDYILSGFVATSFDSVRVAFNEPIDDRFQFLKLSFSTPDMLV